MASNRKRDSWIVCLLVALATVCVYGQVVHFSFVSFDDPDYVYENSMVREGLSWKTIKWAFTTSHASNWHPLTWLSHLLDWTLYGSNAGGHHVTNLLLHLATSLVLFFALRRLTGTIWRSGLVCALFALHPLHVESVAWISERKDVLSALFWMLTMFFYAGYTASVGTTNGVRQRLQYGFAIASFTLGLLAKQMLVTLPFVLLLLDLWPLKRCQPWTWTRLAKLVVEKIPFFLIAAIFIPIVVSVQKGGGAVVAVDLVPLDQRLENAVVSYSRYALKLLWPTKLAVFYPYPDIWPLSVFLSAAAFFVVGWVVALWKFKTKPYLFVGWSFFIGTLVPVIGIVQVGAQSMADRYSYIPSVGFFVAAVWICSDIVSEYATRRRIAAVVAVAVLVTLSVAAYLQTTSWRDSVTLYSRGLRNTERNLTLEMNLGSEYLDLKLTNAAIERFEAALKVYPNDPLTHGNLARIYTAQRNWAEGNKHYEIAITSSPYNARLQNSYGYALLRQGRVEEALAHLRRALELNPSLAPALFNYGDALRQSGKDDEAIKMLERGLEIEPNEPGAHAMLGTLYYAHGKLEQAQNHLETALRLRPGFGEAHRNLALVLIAPGRQPSPAVLREAGAHLRKAIEINGNDFLAFTELGSLALRTNDLRSGVSFFQKALAIKPDMPEILNNLAWILATSSDNTIRDGKEAVRLANRACEQVHFQVPVFVGTLAAAYAESGDFAKAVETGEKAYQLAQDSGKKDVAERNLELLKLYRAGQPYHEPKRE
jgi:tetratricopeptide (TPR) repeat protein